MSHSSNQLYGIPFDRYLSTRHVATNSAATFRLASLPVLIILLLFLDIFSERPLLATQTKLLYKPCKTLTEAELVLAIGITDLLLSSLHVSIDTNNDSAYELHEFTSANILSWITIGLRKCFGLTVKKAALLWLHCYSELTVSRHLCHSCPNLKSLKSSSMISWSSIWVPKP